MLSRRLLAEYGAAAGLLPHALPLATPPAGAWAGIESRIRAAAAAAPLMAPAGAPRGRLAALWTWLQGGGLRPALIGAALLAVVSLVAIVFVVRGAGLPGGSAGNRAVVRQTQGTAAAATLAAFAGSPSASSVPVAAASGTPSGRAAAASAVATTPPTAAATRAPAVPAASVSAATSAPAVAAAPRPVAAAPISAATALARSPAQLPVNGDDLSLVELGLAVGGVLLLLGGLTLHLARGRPRG
ncbi:MAG TPA: hypothetical protein VKV26_11485 [Dehalococcoidia bacterium]|nr:hypothetical protein [Dehalococcoidia bacterium]